MVAPCQDGKSPSHFASADSIHHLSRGSSDTDNVQTSIFSDTHLPSIASTVSTGVVFQPSLVDQLVIFQFSQIKTILTFFLDPRQETPQTALCNYLATEVENLDERNFQTFRNEIMKFLSGVQNQSQESASRHFGHLPAHSWCPNVR